MAKNYTFSEAVEIIAKGTNLEAITDIGRRYPVLAHKVAVVAAKAGESFVDLMGYMPDYLTANKVNSAIKAGIAETTSDDEDEAEENTTEATDEETTEDAGEVKWDESMSAKQLWDILGKAGKRKEAKSTKKADLIEACKKVFGAAEAEDTEDAEDEVEETESNAYEGKSAMELFKECKKRGIKAAAKKPAKFYTDLLIKDDEAKSEDTEESDDDWGDDEAETSKEEKKPAKKTEKKADKKAKKVETEDEDDDWDI